MPMKNDTFRTLFKFSDFCQARPDEEASRKGSKEQKANSAQQMERLQDNEMKGGRDGLRLVESRRLHTT